jgi:NAD(P)-dependent dehydrogenase (short-subunit alcohol dehydrogenase family)
MKDLNGRTVLVTGAAGGIGLATAMAFAREGARLVLVDVDGDRLEEAEAELLALGTECRTYTVDVSSEEQVRDLAARTEVAFGGLDVLVNVAGVAIGGDIADTTVDDWRWIMGVNLWGPINAIGAFLPGMLERGSGHVVNIASAGGLVAVPGLGAYCTTKFALVGLSEALYQEARERNVSVTVVCPGLTNTGMYERIRYRGVSREKAVRLFARIVSRCMPAEKTGELIVRAVQRDRFLLVTTAHGRLGYLAKRLSPGLTRLVLRQGRRAQNVSNRLMSE